MLIAIVAGVAAATANITCLTNAALATLIRLAGAAVVSSNGICYASCRRERAPPQKDGLQGVGPDKVPLLMIHTDPSGY